MKKRLSIVAIALLLIVGTITTFAWLTDGTDEIINTFTFANIQIELKEEYTQDSVLYPGAEIDKKPTVTVKATSADSYVYVKIVNELVTTNGDKGATIYIHADWVSIGENVYRYKEPVTQSTTDTVLTSLFTTVFVPIELSNAEIQDIADNTITIEAFAIQSDAITLPEADFAAKEYFN